MKLRPGATIIIIGSHFFTFAMFFFFTPGPLCSTTNLTLEWNSYWNEGHSGII